MTFKEFCKRGRQARQTKVSPERRKEIASLAAKARWKNKAPVTPTK